MKTFPTNTNIHSKTRAFFQNFKEQIILSKFLQKVEKWDNSPNGTYVLNKKSTQKENYMPDTPMGTNTMTLHKTVVHGIEQYIQKSDRVGFITGTQ